MSELRWTDSLDAPRSLATRGNTAVAAIEDPGVLEIHFAANDIDAKRRCGEIFGAELPDRVWDASSANDVSVICVRPWRWRVIAPRERVQPFIAELAEHSGAISWSDLTGGFACLRIIGETAGEILARVTPTELGAIPPGSARATSIAHIHSLLVHEVSASQSWLVLTPRSYADHVGAVLIEAARTPGRLALYQPSPAPPV